MQIKFSLTHLIVGIVIVVLFMGGLGFLGYKNHKMSEQLLQLQDQQVTHLKLTKSLQRGETQHAEDEADIDQFASDIGLDLALIREDIESLNGRIEGIASTKASTKTVVIREVESTSETPNNTNPERCDDGRLVDTHGYTTKVVSRELRDNNGMLVADVGFNAAEITPWTTKVFGIDYTINNVVSHTETGQLVIHTELLAQNPSEQPSKSYRIEGVNSRVLQAPTPPPEFDWWDPRLFMFGNLAVVVYDDIQFSASLGLGVSFWSYGDRLRVLGITAGYDAFLNRFRASIVPVLFNVGRPGHGLIRNLWIGLDISVDHRADVGVGFLIGTML